MPVCMPDFQPQLQTNGNSWLWKKKKVKMHLNNHNEAVVRKMVRKIKLPTYSVLYSQSVNPQAVVCKSNFYLITLEFNAQEENQTPKDL